MTGIYGELFIKKRGVKDSGVWFKTLSDLTPKAIESALERLMKSDSSNKFSEFPPNCMQFRGLCLDVNDELKLPKVADAFREIEWAYKYRDNRFSHPVVRYTAFRLGDLVNGDFFDVYPRFCEVYQAVCSLIKQGHEIPDIDDRRSKKTNNKEVGARHLHQLKQAGIL